MRSVRCFNSREWTGPDRFNLFGVIDSKDGLQVGIQQNIDEKRDVGPHRAEGSF
jgi:hypothetical protein